MRLAHISSLALPIHLFLLTSSSLISTGPFAMGTGTGTTDIGIPVAHPLRARY
jgi:hypothetical protein